MVAPAFADELGLLEIDGLDWWLEGLDESHLEVQQHRQPNFRGLRPSPIRSSTFTLCTPLSKPLSVATNPRDETPKKRSLESNAQITVTTTNVSHIDKKRKSVTWRAHEQSDHVVDVTESRLAATQRKVHGRRSN